MVRVPAAGTGADLLFTAAGTQGRAAIVVSVSVLPFALPAEVAAGDALGAMLRARDRGDRAVVEEFRTAAGHAAIGIRRIRRGAPADNGRLAFNTGQAQVLVVYRAAGALGVVSGACRHPGDLNATATLVAGLVARMTVTAGAAPGVASAAAGLAAPTGDRGPGEPGRGRDQRVQEHAADDAPRLGRHR
jgi:hypothetical protein